MKYNNYSIDIDLVPLNIAIYKYDIEKDDFLIVDFNRSAEITEKVKREQLIGQYLLSIFPGAKEFGIFDLFKKAHLSGVQQYHKSEFYEDNRISGWRENDIYKIDDTLIMAVYKDLTFEKSKDNRLNMLAGIVDNTYNEIYIFDAINFQFTYMNKQAQKNIGYSFEEMKNMFPWDIKPLYNEESFKNIFYSESFHTIKTTHRRKDKSEYFIEAKIQKMVLNHEENYVAIVSDITEKNRYEKKLVLSKKIIDSISEGVIITDVDTKILDVNPAYLRLSGFNKEEIIGNVPRNFKSGKHDKEFYKNMWSILLKNDVYKGEIWDKKSNGELFLKKLTITTVKDSDGIVQNYVGVFSDITEERRHKLKLQDMAFTDSLTKLSNRVQFKNILKREIEVAIRNKDNGALFLIDLDMFKRVNDTLGHLLGDYLLVAVAKRLKSLVRKSDEVSRIGGDEFTIILASPVQKKSVQFIAQKIIDELAKPFLIDTHEIFIGSSIGISFFPSDVSEIDHLIKSSDLAMYKAKESGRGNYQFFQSKMHEESVKKRNIEIELRKALSSGKIVPYYQPKINLAHGVVVGVEALVRWEHEERGVLSPAYFLDIAEDSGLIHQLGEQVLIKSLRNIKEINDAGYHDFSVAVNLSSKQFDDDELIDKILVIIQRENFNRENLELEITENLIMQDVDRAIDMMRELHFNKIKLSIDDFGTGYSSLNYLKNFPVSYLKIDKSFIDGIVDSKQDRAIVETIMKMAESLNLGVVAEGIENAKQEKYLSQMECTLCQGYLYSKPLSFDNLKKFLAEQKNR